MRQDMVYNPGYYQLRADQLDKMRDIIQRGEDAQAGGVVFFGDSLTELYDVRASYPQLEHVYNCGIGGANSEMLIWMVDEAVVKYQPRLVVLMVGTNDLGRTSGSSPKRIAQNIKVLVDLICGNLSECRVLLWSPLPCVEAKCSYRANPALPRSNQALHRIVPEMREAIREDRVRIVDVFDQFLNDAGDDANETLYVEDGLHLNEAGFARLTGILSPIVEELFAE